MVFDDFAALVNDVTLVVKAGTVIDDRYVAPSTPGQRGYYEPVKLQRDTFVTLELREGTLRHMLVRACRAKGGRASAGPLVVKVVKDGRR